MRLRRGLLLRATFSIGLLSATARAESRAIVVDVVTTEAVDVERLRAAIARELHAQVVAPGSSTETITIETTGGNLSVRYVKGASSVARSVALPDTPERIEASAVILASNVARDEAADLIGSLKKSTPPNQWPLPTARQVEALGVLDDGVKAYERGAKEYRDAVTTVVRLHYEAKKKEVLSGLDREINVEKAELAKARETAIRRLEEFITAYATLPKKHEAVADAMFRLAVLYEEKDSASGRAREHTIRLYERIINEYPGYRERAAVHYFLGHALLDAGRVKEATHAWRALVCMNHFAYPGRGEAPQDHDDAYWREWQRKYNEPKNFSKTNPETAYQEIYPSDCVGITPDSKYLAEAWWQIGNWELDQLDRAAGPWGYNRAESAYARALGLSQRKKSAIYAIALYKHAWALYKQQRYEAATKDFVGLLNHTDEQERLTGDRVAGADFRREAFTYIAGSLANIDFKGPNAWEPFILRKDVLDLEPNLERAEKRLHVAVERVKDATIIPQDRAWTIEIYRALADELMSLGQFTLAVEVRTLMLDRWPLHPSAPETQSALADALDQSNITRKPGTPEHEAIGRKALEARSKLSRYVGGTAWVDANKDNPGALHDAEALAQRALRQAAVQHTNNARAHYERGDFAKALPEYRLAATAWQAHSRSQDPARGPHERESRYWHADARHKIVMATVKLRRALPRAENPELGRDIDEAILHAIEVRDEKDRDGVNVRRDVFGENAAFFVVDVSDVERDLAYEPRVEAEGVSLRTTRPSPSAEKRTRAIARREDVRFDSTDPAKRRVVKDPIPAVVGQSMAAREDFVRVASSPSIPRAIEYRYYVAEQLFLYGHWDEAKPRFESLWREQCGVTAYGHQAWLRLVTMAAKERDADRALALSEAVDPKSGGKSCDAKGEAEYANPLRLEAGLEKARKKLAEAESSPTPAKSTPAWREAALAYERADNPADARAEAKLNAAYAWRKAGEGKKAALLYERVIAETEVGEDGKVSASTSAKEANAHAYDGLLALHHETFDYASLAATNARLARSPLATESRRREAAMQALLVDAGLGDRDAMVEMHGVHGSLHPSANERIAADYRVSVFEYDVWAAADHTARDQARTRATRSLVAFVRAHERETSALLVEASYRIAMLKRDAREPDANTWLRQTVQRRDNSAAGEARKAPHAEHAAEAALLLIDEEMAAFDSPTRHSYGGTPREILRKYRDNAKVAVALDERLEREVVRRYGSAAPEWVLAAVARQGALFDTLRTGLYNATKVTYFDAQGEAVVASLRKTNPDRAVELEDVAKDTWRSSKKKELEDADTIMVRRYATAAHEARRLDIHNNPVIARALGRLVYFTEILGDSAMERYVTSTPDPSTKGATKLAYTSSMYTSFLRVDPPATQPQTTNTLLP